MYDTVIDELATAPSQAWPVLFLRLGGAVLLCGLIGFERESQDRPAGLRTHMLVGLAATVYCLLMLELLGRAAEYPDPVRVDPVRIIEAVTSGVAFLAAGMIIFARGKVRGLTTGASLWLTASVGLACGLGLWPIAAITTALSLMIMRIVRIAETKAGFKKQHQPHDRP
ncbi:MULTISPECIES: MgtC/SapB family protein [unclassified Roseitalea]|uniref:MgtC/SapB family protein n=1 Tax=unclassified Roseitalea TaxID=2639107 RepID=UPI00273F71CA|nr:MULTISPECIES: MgtC/SapB family protein [unclassified Roseitalea]